MNTDGRERPSVQSIALLVGLMVVVALVVLVAHGPSLSAQALSIDDDQYLTENPLVKNPSLSAAGRFLSEVFEPSTVKGYYQPLAMISLMLDHARGGSVDNLRPFHQTSLALHVCNTLLVIVLLYMLFGQPWVAATVGLLFGVHPMTVEPIPWVGERKTLLAAFFALGCLVAYVRYARSGGWVSYVMCLVMFVLALMSKPTSTPLPVCMLLLDFWPLRRLSRRAVIEKLPFFIIGGVSSIVTVVSQTLTASVLMPGEYAPTRMLLTLCHNIVFYLGKIVWPTGLTSHYAFPQPFDLSNARLLIGVLGACVLIPALLVSLRWTPAFLVGWLFFFVAMFPTMGIIGFTNVIASDKFAYLPSLGLMIAAAWGLTRLWHAKLLTTAHRPMRASILLVSVLLVAVEIAATRRYLLLWRETETLYQHMIDMAPHSALLHYNLANALNQQGKTDDAIKHYNEALRLDPRDHRAHNNLGHVLAKRGRTHDAIAHYLKALRINPDYAKAHSNLGAALAQLGKTDDAMTHFARALELNPRYADAHNNVAIVLAQRGEINKAIAHYTEALRLDPGHGLAHCNLATLLLDRGKVDEALEHYAKSTQINPDHSEAHNNTGIALVRKGEVGKAIAHYRRALQTKPRFALAHANLGAALVQEMKLDEAVEAYREALLIQPNNANWHCALGDVLSQQSEIDAAIHEYQEALKIDPNHVKAQSGLRGALAKKRG